MPASRGKKSAKQTSEDKEVPGTERKDSQTRSQGRKSKDRPKSRSSTKEKSHQSNRGRDQRSSRSRRRRSRSRQRSRVGRSHNRRGRRSEEVREITSRSRHGNRADHGSRRGRSKPDDRRRTRSRRGRSKPDDRRRTRSPYRPVRSADRPTGYYDHPSWSVKRSPEERNPFQRPRSDGKHNTQPGLAGSGGFLQAMNAIATNAEAHTKGVFSGISGGDDNFKEQFAQALALKLNFKTTQQANEKALKQLLAAKGSAYGLKQVLQARAAIYDNLLDPAWFVKNFDLSAKAKGLSQRREARAMLIGAVLLIAQIGAHDIRSRLNAGKSGMLKEVMYDTRRGTAAQFVKFLSQAPMLEVMELISKEKKEQVTEKLLQHADDLDYLQTLVTSLGREPALNPSMNAVEEAYARRRFTGRFKTTGQSVRLDTLLYKSTRGTADDDEATSVKGKPRQPSYRLCFKFQKGECRWPSCTFQHKCRTCASTEHGADECPLRNSQRAGTNSSGARSNQQPDTTRPPHPRYRRDRAHDGRAL